MIAVLLAGTMCVVLNQTLLSPALPSIMSSMSVDETTVQWLTSAYSITEAIFIPLSAWFMGRFKPKRLFTSGMIVFAAGSILAATAPTFPILLVGRIIQASATGVLMAMSTTLVLLSFPLEKRGQAMGLVGLAIVFAPAIGPTLGGILTEFLGWRVLFAIIAGVALVIAIAARSFNAVHQFPTLPLDAPSVVLSSVGLVSLLYGIASIASSDNSILCLIFIIIGVAALVLYGRRMETQAQPMLKIALLHNGRYRVSVIVIALVDAILIGLEVLMPLYIQNVLLLGALASGLVTLPGALARAATSVASGRLYDHNGARGIVAVGSVSLVLGCLGMLSLNVGTSLAYVAACYALIGVGVQSLMTTVNAWGISKLCNGDLQHATALTNTVTQIGGSLGTAFVVSIAAYGITRFSSNGSSVNGIQLLADSYHLSFIVLLSIAIIISALIFLYVRDETRNKQQ